MLTHSAPVILRRLNRLRTTDVTVVIGVLTQELTMSSHPVDDGSGSEKEQSLFLDS